MLGTSVFSNASAVLPWKFWGRPTEANPASPFLMQAWGRHLPVCQQVLGKNRANSDNSSHPPPFLKTDAESLSEEKHKLPCEFLQGFHISSSSPKLSCNFTKSCFTKTFPTFHRPPSRADFYIKTCLESSVAQPHKTLWQQIAWVSWWDRKVDYIVPSSGFCLLSAATLLFF